MALSNEMKADFELDITSEGGEESVKVKGKGSVECKTSWKREEKAKE